MPLCLYHLKCGKDTPRPLYQVRIVPFPNRQSMQCDNIVRRQGSSWSVSVKCWEKWKEIPQAFWAEELQRWKVKPWVYSFSSHETFWCKTLVILCCSFSKAAMSCWVTHPWCAVLWLPLFAAPNFYAITWCDSLFQSNIWSAATDVEARVLENSLLGTSVRLCGCLFSAIIKGRRALFAVSWNWLAVQLQHKPFKPR